MAADLGAMVARLGGMEAEVTQLASQLADKRRQVADLAERICAKRRKTQGEGAGAEGAPHDDTTRSAGQAAPAPDVPMVTCGLSPSDTKRYSRQLILRDVGPTGQVKLKAARVLVVGAGGLGCPAVMYLAAAGVGDIGIVDSDTVDLSNLHRQVLYTEASVGQSKAECLATFVRQLNSAITCTAYNTRLERSSAMAVVQGYHLILDCTDNVPTRYLVNDCAVQAKVPLVSGSALRGEGQLTTYNYDGGPCYRCLYPNPPPAATVTNCSEGGVLGVVPGVVGCLQALEAIKLIVGDSVGEHCSRKLKLFDASDTTLRCVRLQQRRANCACCTGDAAKEAACPVGSDGPAHDGCVKLSLLAANHRLSCAEFATLYSAGPGKLVLLDVRPPLEYSICSLQAFSNVPFKTLSSAGEAERLVAVLRAAAEAGQSVVVVCRRGNDSQLAVQHLQALAKEHLPLGSETSPVVSIKDVKGGLQEWARLHPAFPMY